MDRSDAHKTGIEAGNAGAVQSAGRAPTPLERSFGPSCLLSLTIVFLVTVIIRRYVAIPWMGVLILAGVVWFGVLLLLVRWGPDWVEDEG